MPETKIEFGTARSSPYEVARLARQIERLDFNIIGSDQFQITKFVPVTV